MKRWLLLLVAVMVLGLAGPVSAALLDRGGGLIYDDDRDITWLQDANYAMTSGHDADGRMNWNPAMTWADNLVYGGYDDWRLPTALNQDGTGPCEGVNCTGSEMGHLYYTELGNVAGGPLAITFPFINLQPSVYWSGTEFPAIPDAAWYFDFGANPGQQRHAPKDGGEYYAWAVRPGDVSAPVPEKVPEPATMLLLGSGLVGLAGYGRKKFFKK